MSEPTKCPNCGSLKRLCFNPENKSYFCPDCGNCPSGNEVIVALELIEAEAEVKKLKACCRDYEKRLFWVNNELYGWEQRAKAAEAKLDSILPDWRADPHWVRQSGELPAAFIFLDDRSTPFLVEVDTEWLHYRHASGNWVTYRKLCHDAIVEMSRRRLSVADAEHYEMPWPLREKLSRPATSSLPEVDS